MIIISGFITPTELEVELNIVCDFITLVKLGYELNIINSFITPAELGVELNIVNAFYDTTRARSRAEHSHPIWEFHAL